nr:PREDICTED: protein LBH-like [Latimeria chalumnae]|eukprot:XP_006000505.1 PREDICTED: protein LBH-like [Latimeria chalumnae]
MEDLHSNQGEKCLPFQIFPDPMEDERGVFEECCRPVMGRLPSIVVDPTDVIEVESGELRWPPYDITSEDEDNYLYCEQTGPSAPETEEEEEEYLGAKTGAETIRGCKLEGTDSTEEETPDNPELISES